MPPEPRTLATAPTPDLTTKTATRDLPSHSQTRHTQTIATRPADPEEAPSEPTPAPTPEHPVSHLYLPTQKRQPISNVSRGLMPYSKLHVQTLTGCLHR
jgi:hypothetical protein